MSNMIERWLDNRPLRPFRDLSELQESFDKLFNEFTKLKKINGLRDFGFTPSCEITEEGSNYVLKFDIPGVSKEQVKVEVDKDQITVSAERKEEIVSDQKKKFLSELYYGAFSRSFTLPGIADESKIEAKFKDGVLTVIVPKMESLQTKQIPIH